MRLLELFEETVIRWTPGRSSTRALESGSEVVVWIDVAKLDAAWAKDRDFYVGRGGTVSAIKGRYERFEAWVKGGEAVEMPVVGFGYGDSVAFTDGRHRVAWMRDHGATAIPVVTDADRAKEFETKFGTNGRQTIVR